MSEETKTTGQETVEVETVSIDLLPATTRGEIDIQITTAKRYPRSITAFKRQALEMATLDAKTAASMFYVLPARKSKSGEKSKPIEGGTIRFAEVAGAAYGNIRYGSRITDIGDKFITAEGMCFDLEKNVACSIQVRRRITTKDGYRYSDDMIQVTGNAACSIALRNAIFKVIPAALMKDIYDKAKMVSVGEEGSMDTKRANVVAEFSKVGMTEKQLLQVIEKKGRADITLDDMIMLKGILTALKDGDTTVAELLGENTNARTGIQDRLNAAKNAQNSTNGEKATTDQPKTEIVESKPQNEANSGTVEANADDLRPTLEEPTETDLPAKPNANDLLKQKRARLTELMIEFGKIKPHGVKTYNEIMTNHGAAKGPSHFKDHDSAQVCIDELEGWLRTAGVK